MYASCHDLGMFEWTKISVFARMELKNVDLLGIQRLSKHM